MQGVGDSGGQVGPPLPRRRLRAAGLRQGRAPSPRSRAIPTARSRVSGCARRGRRRTRHLPAARNRGALPPAVRPRLRGPRTTTPTTAWKARGGCCEHAGGLGDAVGRELDLPTDLDVDAVLDLARDVAHGVARPAAPLTAFLVGLAAGRDGGSRDCAQLRGADRRAGPVLAGCIRTDHAPVAPAGPRPSRPRLTGSSAHPTRGVTAQQVFRV